jgi:hypothetical protein
MLSYLSNASTLVATAGWCAILAITLWLLSATASPVALFAVAVIGLTPAVVLLVLARRPAQTITEAVRAVYERRAE